MAEVRDMKGLTGTFVRYEENPSPFCDDRLVFRTDDGREFHIEGMASQGNDGLDVEEVDATGPALNAPDTRDLFNALVARAHAKGWTREGMKAQIDEAYDRLLTDDAAHVRYGR